jgi:hypothetical protein
MLIVIILFANMMSDIILFVNMLSVIILFANMMSVIILFVNMLSIILFFFVNKLSVVMLNEIILRFIILFFQYAECHSVCQYADCHCVSDMTLFFNMLCVIILCWVFYYVREYAKCCHSAVSMLCVIIPFVNMLSVAKLSANMLIVVAPFKPQWDYVELVQN